MEISNLSDAEFKTLVIRMLKELSEDLNSIKKIQAETKDTIIEIKNLLKVDFEMRLSWVIQWAQSNHESFKVENVSQLQSERDVVKEERSERCNVSGFDDGGRGHQVRHVGGL